MFLVESLQAEPVCVYGEIHFFFFLNCYGSKIVTGNTALNLAHLLVQLVSSFRTCRLGSVYSQQFCFFFLMNWKCWIVRNYVQSLNSNRAVILKVLSTASLRAVERFGGWGEQWWKGINENSSESTEQWGWGKMFSQRRKNVWYKEEGATDKTFWEPLK